MSRSTRVLGIAVAGVVGTEPKFLAQRAQKLGGRQARIEDQSDLGGLRRAREQRADGRGLAGADLAGQLDEAAGFVDAVDQMRQRVGVPAAQVEIARIRRDCERLFGEAEELQVHSLTSPQWRVLIGHGNVTFLEATLRMHGTASTGMVTLC